MDNDNQVGREVARVKELFLAETFGTQIRPPQVYNVEEEFSKTRQNRNPVVTLTVLAFVVIFVAVAVVVTLFIQRESQRIEFDITEFQDVNLTEILDVQKRNENSLEVAIRELADLEAQRDTQIESIRSDIAGRIELVTNENLTVAARSTRIANLRAEEQALIDAVNREFEPLILAKREEIETIQARIAEYDSRLIEEAKRTEERINNQQELYSLEKLELTDYYDKKLAELEQQSERERADLTRQKDELVALLKSNHAAELSRQFNLYNPTFQEQPIVALLGRDLNPPDADLSSLPPFRSLLESESVISRRSFQELRTSLTDYDALLSRLEAVPYRNSIPESFRALRELETILIARYEYLWTTLSSNVEAKNATIAEQASTIASQTELIARYAYAIDYFARGSRENGYILDARDPREILVHVNPSIPVQPGSAGYVFRAEDDFIAEIRVYPDRAELVALADPSRPIQPFDIVLIQLQ